ncbi:L-threonylcarbamoyladenylate synthase [Desulfofundulus thermocisternus]|uniref:L-threonylcarbamoyladenylate synthase n=1 Tax=Desulfofundulus thermocisternus TaxID=42471 RepID=UPI00217DE375|nr:L-threonylcarbamoyladenylate synthase [Desulfofundulus thermocisternus]MCS5695496.1 L-threonylcarbamoyladenylate synthase [Desulfofundulus thermocisternus]
MELRTAYWQVDPVEPRFEIIGRAGMILRRGGLVAFPTETVYGLGASALDGRAVRRIFEVKGRPPDNPLIVHVAGRGMLRPLVRSWPATAEKLVAAFWPGPLTLVLPAAPGVPREVTAGLDTVGIRMPAHPVALALIASAGIPVAAPSANLSGRPSPTTAGHVLQDLNGRIDAILDAGPAGVGVESTVLDLVADVPVILRPGGITPEELEKVIGKVKVDPGADGGDVSRPRSPGMKYRHYAPRVPLVLVEGEPERVAARLKELADNYRALGRRVGILATAETAGKLNGGQVVVAGSRQNPAAIASRLFAALRQLEGRGVDVILAEGIEPRGLGLAVMNRLRRAAGGHIERV